MQLNFIIIFFYRKNKSGSNDRNDINKLAYCLSNGVKNTLLVNVSGNVFLHLNDIKY